MVKTLLQECSEAESKNTQIAPSNGKLANAKTAIVTMIKEVPARITCKQHVFNK